MRTLKNLANEIRQTAEDFGKQGNEAKKRVARVIIRDLVRVTPVDTSKAVSNWQIGLGAPVASSDVIEPHVPGVLGYTGTASGRIALQLAESRIDQARPGQPLYVGNAVDYIRDLNNGSSKQEPANFIERAVILGRKQVQRE